MKKLLISIALSAVCDALLVIAKKERDEYDAKAIYNPWTFVVAWLSDIKAHGL